MKNLILKISMILVAALLCAGIADAKKKSANGGSINFAEKVYDFGKIKEKGGLVTHEFTFTNDGEGNLVVLKATAECGCTRPSFSEAPVAPGKSGKIKVSYNPLSRPGTFEKTVTVTTSGNPSKVHLKIRGTVVE